MTYVLGVDAGGTKTMAMVVDGAGTVLGTAEAGPGSHERVGLEPAMTEIRQAVFGALAAAGLEPDQIQSACYGLAGADWPEDFTLLADAVAHHVGIGRQRVIKHDTLIALRAGTRDPYGGVVIFGTGAAGAGCGRDGAEVVLGNLGYLYGDHCGAQAMAHETLRAVFRAADLRAPETLLTGLCLEALGLPSVQELRTALHEDRIPYECINRLAHQCLRAAAGGDGAAGRIVADQVTETGRMGVAVVRSLGLEADRFDMVMAGGLWKALPAESAAPFHEAITAVAPGARFVRPQLDPVAGAVIIALEEAGLAVGKAVRSRLQAQQK